MGVRLEHDGIVERLLAAGARPGAGPHDVRLPPAMVRELVALAPRRVELAARDGTTTVLEPESETRLLDDAGPLPLDRHRAAPGDERGPRGRSRGSRDRLDAVQGVMGVAMADVPPLHRDFVGLRVIAEGTRKHARVLCFSPRGMDALVRMKPVFPGPWFSVGFTAHGPLRWTNLALEVFARSAGHGIPVTVNGEPMAGASAPVTLAGAFAVGNAEILAGHRGQPAPRARPSRRLQPRPRPRLRHAPRHRRHRRPGERALRPRLGRPRPLLRPAFVLLGLDRVGRSRTSRPPSRRCSASSPTCRKA